MSATLPRPFLNLAWSNLAAQSAEQLSLAAVPLVAVLALGAGPGEIGFLAAVQTLPFLLVSMPMGLLADRMSRRRLMVWCEALRAVSLLVLLAMVLASSLSIGGLAVLGFLGAVGTVGFSVAAPALVPSLVPREALAAANGRLELARSAAFTAGPALAGALVAWAGAPAAFVLAALLSVSAVGLLLRWSRRRASTHRGRHPLLDVRDGARFVWRHELLRPMLMTGAVFNISWFVLQAGYVPYAVRVLGLGAQAVGFTLAMYGAGMVAGALLTSRRGAHAVRPRHPGRAGGGRCRGGHDGATLASCPPRRWPRCRSSCSAPGRWSGSSPRPRCARACGRCGMLGRVSAVFLTINAGARPIGAALGGVVGAAWGEPACLLLALAGFALQAAIIFASRIAGLQRLPAAAG
jgi:MFS family permease